MARHETEMHRERRILRQALEVILDLTKPIGAIDPEQLLETIRSYAEEALQTTDAGKAKVYYCTVCGQVPVDAPGGFDTCDDCARRI